METVIRLKKINNKEIMNAYDELEHFRSGTGGFDRSGTAGISLEKLTIELESEGGDLYLSLFFHDYLVSLIRDGITVVTKALSFCGSSAVNIFCAGQNRKCYTNTVFLIHEASFPREDDTTKSMLANAEFVKTAEDICYNIYENVSNKSAYEWKELVKEQGEVLLRGGNAYECGLATELL